MPGKLAPVACPKCGGPCWDNREGKRNPKAPDYACKDKQGCGAGVWLNDTEKAALAVAAPAKQNGAPARPPVVLDKMMRACVAAAQKIAAESFVDGEVKGLDHALTLNMAVTLYISRCRNEGILEVEKKALAELAAKAAEEKLEAARKAELIAAAERERQASMSQVGGPNDWPHGDPPFSDESLPF